LCIKALSAAYGDVNRAFEYLEFGIPNTGNQQQQQPRNPQPVQQQPAYPDYGDEDMEGGAGGLSPALMALAQNENFDLVR
jgi:hypothetical protein